MEALKYDKDLRQLRWVARIVCAVNLVTAAMNFRRGSWPVGCACIVWAVAMGVAHWSATSQQKTRIATRATMAAVDEIIERWQGH